MKWLLAAGSAIAVVVAAFVILVVSDFADIPCQDAVWDPELKTCVP
ncbi:hypothetical protein [Pararhizobium sp.]|nr:hypothetical protein [Pararhizobium sp.]MDO9417922.1 hypothetical protein [Pararhizobium sp.]